MELTRPVTQEELKKNYKKLSLRYHPDRNGGSKESQNQMQMLNACMDLIGRELAGVSAEDEENDAENGGNEDQEDPREKYMRMRREMQEEMEKEMKRQQEMRDNFEANKEKEKVECAKRSKALKLDTPDGRRESNQAFAREVRQTKEQQTTESSSTERSKTNKTNMDDIDDHHEEKPTPTSPSEENKNKTDAKPRNEIMDCNTNEFAVALRMGMPDIAINLLREQIQKFFKEASHNMYFEGKKKSDEQLRLEWLQQPLDMDENTVLHYAVYYESFQTMKTICQVVAKDRHIDAVVLQSNIHGQSPLFFAEIAKDPSILSLVKSQMHLSEQIKQRTQLIPALKSACKRFFAIFRHLSLVTTLSTALAFYIARVVFDLHVVTSIFGLVIMQYLGKGTSRVVSLLTFCAMWKLAVIAIAFISQFIMFELALIMAPIVVAGIVSSASKKHGGLMGRILLPFVFHAGVCQRIEPVLVLCQKYVTPSVVRKRGWDQPYSLSLVILICLGFDRLRQEI